jgi:cyclic peptide transporter
MGSSYVGYFLSTLFPHQNKYIKALPLVIVLSLLTGAANAAVIFLVTVSFRAVVDLIYLLYFFGLTMVLYLVGRKLVQTKLIKITFDIVYDLRMKLIGKISLTSYQKFETIDRGRVFATLNDDTGQIGGTANIIVGLITSIITIVAAFIFLATIAFWATLVTALVITAIATLYYTVSRKTRRYFEEARDTQNVYMGLLNGLIDGFKELSLHHKKRHEYKDDIEKSCEHYRSKLTLARIKFLNAFMVGESLLITILGAVGFAVPRLLPNTQIYTLMSFIMVLLYLIGPINGILNAIPNILQLRIAWNRIQEFFEDIPANMNPNDLVPLREDKKVVENIEVRGLMFEYKNEDEDEDEDDENEEDNFAIGPVDFEAKRGNIIFIIGGNGSGKTTLAKVLTGLYAADKGSIAINGKPISNHQLGEFFSTVFDDYHLFKKLYNIDLTKKAKKAHQYLKILRLQDKVEFVNNSYSTIDLSGGQKKRLALLQCYLEDSPIFLFDEVAADQDPTFRKFFYRNLLSRMKEQGKIVIAITHDDHYFDVADKVIKMDMGKIESIDSGNKYRYKITA